MNKEELSEILLDLMRAIGRVFEHIPAIPENYHLYNNVISAIRRLKELVDE